MLALVVLSTLFPIVVGQLIDFSNFTSISLNDKASSIAFVPQSNLLFVGCGEANLGRGLVHSFLLDDAGSPIRSLVHSSTDSNDDMEGAGFGDQVAVARHVSLSADQIFVCVTIPGRLYLRIYTYTVSTGDLSSVRSYDFSNTFSGGTSLALSAALNDTAWLVGSPEANGGAGIATLVAMVGTVGVGSISTSGMLGSQLASFGSHVAAFGDRLLISAPSFDHPTFEYSSRFFLYEIDNYTQKLSLLGVDDNQADTLEQSTGAVACFISRDLFIIGQPGNGAVNYRIVTRDGIIHDQGSRSLSIDSAYGAQCASSPFNSTHWLQIVSAPEFRYFDVVYVSVPVPTPVSLGAAGSTVVSHRSAGSVSRTLIPAFGKTLAATLLGTGATRIAVGSDEAAIQIYHTKPSLDSNFNIPSTASSASTPSSTTQASSATSSSIDSAPFFTMESSSSSSREAASSSSYSSSTSTTLPLKTSLPDSSVNDDPLSSSPGLDNFTLIILGLIAFFLCVIAILLVFICLFCRRQQSESHKVAALSTQTPLQSSTIHSHSPRSGRSRNRSRRSSRSSGSGGGHSHKAMFPVSGVSPYGEIHLPPIDNNQYTAPETSELHKNDADYSSPTMKTVDGHFYETLQLNPSSEYEVATMALD